MNFIRQGKTLENEKIKKEFFMKWIKDPGKRLLLSLLMAMVLSLFLGAKQDPQPLTGFWGILYPEYSFSEVPDGSDLTKCRITFRWLRTPSIGDKIGEKYQSECSYEDR